MSQEVHYTGCVLALHPAASRWSSPQLTTPPPPGIQVLPCLPALLLTLLQVIDDMLFKDHMFDIALPRIPAR